MSNSPSSYVRLSEKQKARFKKIVERQKLTEQLILEKYIEMVVQEGRVRVEDWVY